jgi:hypothetical protein
MAKGDHMKKIIFAFVAAFSFTLGAAAHAQSTPPKTGSTPPAEATKPGTTTAGTAEAGKTDAKKDGKKEKKPEPKAAGSDKQ